MVNYLFRTHDPRLFEIILHRTRYYNHIRIQHGIDVESIQTAVENPDLITADLTMSIKRTIMPRALFPTHQIYF